MPMTRQQRDRIAPFVHPSKVAPLSFILLLAAFVLLFLVCLSVPIIKSIYIMSLSPTADTGTYAGRSLRFGVWGSCLKGPNDQSVLLGDKMCTDASLGYGTPLEYFIYLGAPDTLVAILTQGLEVVFLFHPIGTGLSSTLVILALLLGSHDMSISALLVGFLAAGSATIAFAADIAFVVVAKDKLNEITNNSGEFKVEFGNAVWMTFVGFLLSWGALILIFGRCKFGPRK